MKKTLLLVIMLISIVCAPDPGVCKTDPVPIVMAVEFCDHAACAHIARNKGWFSEAGLNITSFDNYLTGMTLAAGLARGDINVAYLCLIPAINAYANAKVPLRVIAGTHWYGYGLLVDPEKINSVRDLVKPGIRIGCPREGSPLDALLHRTVERFHLDENTVLTKVRRMPPSKVFLAMKMGRLDAGFCPEQFPTMGEAAGLRVLLTARDLWPEMQGSVLVVKQDLIRDHPETVRKLVAVSRKGIRYIHEHPRDAAAIVARALSVTGETVLPAKMGKVAAGLEITPEVIFRSMTEKMVVTMDVDPRQVQQSIDYMAELGYITRFEADEIMDLRFLCDE